MSEPFLDRTAEKVPKLKTKLREIAELGEFEDMKSFMLKSMEDHWLGQGMERGVTVGMEQARAEERARLCELARRKFSRRAAERLAATIDGVSSADRLAEVGNWIIDCGTEAEFLARAQPGG